MIACMETLRPFLPILAIAGMFGPLTLGAAPRSSSVQADIVVYGATASGVMTAYAAAREGMHVILLEPGRHVGGMVTGGLSATDLGQSTVIGGYARDFYVEAAAHYGVHDLYKPENWRSEPHVDEEIFRTMLRDAGVDLRLDTRLKEHGGVNKIGPSIRGIETEDGTRWRAKVYADCSYEGDLMAEAGVRYTVGRESRDQYGEDLAGVRWHSPGHQFTWPLSAYDENHRLLPEIDPGPLAPQGSGDKKVQAYNFRLILTNDPASRLPFPRPAHYNPADFALLRRYLSEFKENKGREPGLRDVTNPVLIPNHKADFNNNGPVSTDYIGHSWKYPDGTYAQRTALWNKHLAYTESFFYFISHDASVPENLRREANEWGLPRDEFADTRHWPNQLYIREGRRMLGVYVMRQKDLQTERTKPDSIGMGSYNSDSHNIQRVAQADGTVINEGDVQVPVEPYEIPYRVILPQQSEADNLLVPVCLSASHTAYSSVRMEPQYMIIGQAAGVAASMAVQAGVPVQKIEIDKLQAKLHARKAVLHLMDADANKEAPR